MCILLHITVSVIDCVVAIERVGPAADGSCYTMRGLCMDDLAAPLELLLISPPEVLDISQAQAQAQDREVVIPVVPPSVLALEAAAATSSQVGNSGSQHTNTKPVPPALSEGERTALLALLESDIELTDEQFEALALLGPPPPPVASEEDTNTANTSIANEGQNTIMSNIEEEVDMEVEVKFDTPSYDYSNSNGMSMEEMMAELPPPPKHPSAFLDMTDNGENNLYRRPQHTPNTSITSIGIGDGGNEVGMGKILALVESSQIANAADIACVIPTDHLHVASVSNWGGYALAAAVVTILIHESDEIMAEVNSANESNTRLNSNKDSVDRMSVDVGTIVDSLRHAADTPLVTSMLSKAVLRAHMDGKSTAEERETLLRDNFLPRREQQVQACEGLVAAGAQDGISQEEGVLSVDGMPLEMSLTVLEEINAIVIASLATSL